MSQLWYFSGSRRQVHSKRHNLWELSWAQQTPSGGSKEWRWPLSLLPMQLRCLPRHSLRPLPPSILPRMRHLRHRRLHLWQRRSGLPKLQPLRTQAQPKPEKPVHCTRQRRPKPEHWNFDLELQGRGCCGFNPSKVIVQDLLGSPLEKLFQDRLSQVLHGGFDRPSWVVGVGWQFRIGYSVLWGVPE